MVYSDEAVSRSNMLSQPPSFPAAAPTVVIVTVVWTEEVDPPATAAIRATLRPTLVGGTTRSRASVYL